MASRRPGVSRAWSSGWTPYLQFARTGDYAAETFVIKVMSGEDAAQHFLPYVLADRASSLRVGLARRPWPEDEFDRVA